VPILKITIMTFNLSKKISIVSAKSHVKSNKTKYINGNKTKVLNIIEAIPLMIETQNILSILGFTFDT
jgi:hypothetical protein